MKELIDGDDPEPSDPLPAGPLYVPVRPGPSGCTTRLFRTPLGDRTAVAFSSEERLTATLGAGQPWIRLAEPALRALTEPLGVTTVTVDPLLTAPSASPVRRPEPALTGSQPALTGSQPVLTGSQPVLTGAKPAGTGAKPAGTGAKPAGTGAKPAATAAKPAATAAKPAATAAKPAATAAEPATTGADPATTGTEPAVSVSKPAALPPARHPEAEPRPRTALQGVGALGLTTAAAALIDALVLWTG
ncbi:hypothetical protein Sm713_60430 [Streptomyces sp. TS71-3]|nr:hypothetical protein Sm713_60430 [Streptomyces sp. TS71-3]